MLGTEGHGSHDGFAADHRAAGRGARGRARTRGKGPRCGPEGRRLARCCLAWWSLRSLLRLSHHILRPVSSAPHREWVTDMESPSSPGTGGHKSPRCWARPPAVGTRGGAALGGTVTGVPGGQGRPGPAQPGATEECDLVFERRLERFQTATVGNDRGGDRTDEKQ